MNEVVLILVCLLLSICLAFFAEKQKQRKQRRVEAEREARIARFYELKDQLGHRAADKTARLEETKIEETRLAVESLPTRPTIRYASVCFENLVLPSGYNTPYTEIDELIISPYGIFCIEYKAHVGIIFGSEKGKYWTQCKYTEKISIPNPLRQNYKHVKAVEQLLGNRIKAPIHNYAVFTNAKKLNVDSQYVFSDMQAAQAKIDNHIKQIYSIEEWGEILDLLAKASSESAELLPIHIRTLSQYLEAR